MICKSNIFQITSFWQVKKYIDRLCKTTCFTFSCYRWLGGYYIYIEADGRRDGANATIISRAQTIGKYCLSFWYSIYGSHIKALSVYLKSHNGSVLVFERNIEANSAAWIQDKVNIESNDMFQVSFTSFDREWFILI